MAFTPRYTDPTGTALSTYWTTFTGECVWYTIGRIREVAGTPTWDPNRAWPVTLSSIQEAKQIYPNADEANGWIKDGNRPSLGAIACWTGTAGHCMNVEAISGSTITLSGYNFPNHHQFAILTYDLSTIINSQISGLGAFQGFVRNPYVQDIPPSPTTPQINITPSGYNATMLATESYIDFSFNIEVSGIPEDESASGGNTYPGLSRVYNTGWSYTSYTIGGVVYKRATKSQTLRYDREYPTAYTTTKHMYFDYDFSNGSIHSDTVMSINVEPSSIDEAIIVAIGVTVNGKKKKFKVQIV